MDEDFLLALQLQEQFNYERPISIVDESWELLDPNPDVRAMFLSFNDMFFWGKLSAVEVRWSSRMTLCAGLCCYEGRGGLCSIRLSEPLLKLRPRRDLVQTLLHEMIHALLFVTQNNRDREGHGPEFCKHMDRINKDTGANITVYHNFSDEVDLYRQHWWRCNGPCQNRKPFFGYVKRAMNRAPSARDPWWDDHKHSCGGTFIKIKEPENYGKKDKKDIKGHVQPADKRKSGVQDIRNVLPFSGKGFVLGGKPQPLSPEKQLELSYGKPPTDCPGFTETMWSSSSTVLTTDLSVPGESRPSKMGDRVSVSSDSRGPQTPSTRPTPQLKKSVSNTKAFVNINGSPLRISGTLDSNFSRAKQKSFTDLMSPREGKSSPWAGLSSANSSSSSPPIKTMSPFNSTQYGTSSGDLQRPASSSSFVNSGPASSRHSNSLANSSAGSHLNSKPGKPSSTLLVSRKRPFDTSTSTIFDFFRKQTSTSSAVSNTRETPVPIDTDSSAQPALPLATQGASARATDPTVSCPVCHTTMLQSEINVHLDSCLT
ncbi:sprT-like domain-containing protein Spartan [Arapaima gigas]